MSYLNKNNRIFFFVFTAIILFCSCAVKPPGWIMDPFIKDKICAVGVCGPHINGFHAQRYTAISRAFDEIARQKGVTVDANSEHSFASIGQNSVSQLSEYSVQTTTGQVVSARLYDTWLDRKTNMFYVRMYSE
jgi:hypothetical protein